MITPSKANSSARLLGIFVDLIEKLNSGDFYIQLYKFKMPDIVQTTYENHQDFAIMLETIRLA
jgi:hypothetical protein